MCQFCRRFEFLILGKLAPFHVFRNFFPQFNRFFIRGLYSMLIFCIMQIYKTTV